MKKIGKWHWADFEELDSTNDKAVALSKQPPAAFYVVTAKRQTKGRGRRGREWISREGNLFMSVGLPFDVQNIGHLVFIVSLSLFFAVKKIAPAVPLFLKWPNDLLVANQKISGILLEKGENGYIIAGIGVNVVSAPDLGKAASYRSASLKSLGVETDRTEILKCFLHEFDIYLQLWNERGFASVKKIWLENVKGLGEEIVVNGEKEKIRGVFRGVDETGLLLLEHDDKVIKIFAGDIVYVQKD